MCVCGGGGCRSVGVADVRRAVCISTSNTSNNGSSRSSHACTSGPRQTAWVCSGVPWYLALRVVLHANGGQRGEAGGGGSLAGRCGLRL